MPNEKFLNDENTSVLWSKFKKYINNNTATIEGGLKVELDPDMFSEPPYTLKFIIEDVDNSEPGGGNDNLPILGTSLNDCTWEQISKISTSEQAANYFAVGDKKNITLNGQVGDYATYDNQELSVYILDFNYNEESTGIVFGCFKNITTNIDISLDNNWNQYNTSGKKYFNINHWGSINYGGWAGCDLRYDILGSTDIAPSNYGSPVSVGRTGYNATENCAINPIPNTLMATLPIELRTVMKPMIVYTDNVGGGNTEATSITSSVDYLPLLSAVEVFGITSVYCNTYEQNYQTQLQYYLDGNSKIRTRLVGNKAGFYWLRSPSIHNRGTGTDANIAFCGGGNTGYLANYDVYYSVSIAPMFLI